MTNLTKAVRRKSDSIVRDRGKIRVLVGAMYPGGVFGIRPLGTRREEFVTFGAVYSLAVKQRVAMERREKKATRKARTNRK